MNNRSNLTVIGPSEDRMKKEKDWIIDAKFKTSFYKIIRSKTITLYSLVDKNHINPRFTTKNLIISDIKF